MKAQDLINLINENPLYSLWDADDVIDKKAKKVASHLELDEHRWYSTAVNVYECEDGFVGIFGVYQSFSESQMLDDINVVCEASRYKEVKTVTYIPE